ncbi:MAG TPA: type II toxin-antitoxin system RelE/ParE family toxin [Balneolaceae bacterium]
MKIKFHSEARKEFFESAEYYEEQVVGLGDNFIDEIEKVLGVIEQQPSSGTKITGTERRFLVSRFPYGIIYSVDDDLITVFAVMNLRRKPGYGNLELKAVGITP